MRYSVNGSTIIIGNCVKIMQSLTPKFQLVFADPPFNYGVDYGTWDDKMPESKYEEFTEIWLQRASRLLLPTGSMWVHIPDEIVAFVDTYCRKRLKLTRINWCIIHHRFGQCISSRFIRSKCHGLYYAKNASKRVWNQEQILVPSDRATKYNDPRTRTTSRPGMRVPLDVFEYSRVQGNDRERRPLHKNQLREKYLERVILATTNPNDWVLDPFVGSGTTCVVASALNRRSVGIEISPKFASSAASRVKQGAIRVC